MILPHPLAQKDSKVPESMEQMNARYQQEDYWGQLYGSGTTSYVNPTFADPSTAPFMPQAPQFPPPPPPYVAPSYGFDAFGSWMFDQHVDNAGQGSSRQDGRQDDEDDDQ